MFVSLHRRVQRVRYFPAKPSMIGGCASLCSYPFPFTPSPFTPHSHPLPVELRLATGSEHFQRPLFADRVRAVEDPVLPRGEPAEDARLHGFGAGEAQVRLQSAER